ncbi:MAG: hypothetical protein ACUVYA_13540 [Planctomycetota bacterium]
MAKVRTARSGLLLLLAATGLPAATIRVPGDHFTIQEAVDAAADGDTVLVADGVYAGGGEGNRPVVDFRGKAVYVRSEHGPGRCVLERGEYVVRFASGETRASVLEGFTIRRADPGAGIGCFGASPTILRNIVVDNWSEYGLGAILLHDSAAIVHGNVVAGNRVYGDCAGIVCCHGSDATISSNTIVGNGDITGWNGSGAVLCRPGARARVVNCISWANGSFDFIGCDVSHCAARHPCPGRGNIQRIPRSFGPAIRGRTRVGCLTIACFPAPRASTPATEPRCPPA